MYRYIVLRTQISLTEEDRRLLDSVATRTGRSVAALIRDAVQRTYAPAPSSDVDLDALRSTAGAWTGRDQDGEAYVAGLRSGRRLTP